MPSSITESIRRHYFQDLTNILIGILMWILLLPIIILPIVLPLTLYRFLVHFLASIFRPDLISITNPIDNMYIIAPTHGSGDIGANLAHVWKINGKLNAFEFRNHFYNTFLCDQKIRKKYQNLYCYFIQWMGYCFKKPVNKINLEEQIQEGAWNSEDLDNLENFVGKWANENDFGDKSPAWKILIIHINNADDVKLDKNEFQTILLFKIDHGLADGYSKTDIVDKLTGNKSPHMVPEKLPSLVNKIKTTLSSPKICFDLQRRWQTTKDIPHFSKSKIYSETNRRISFTTLDLELVKKVRKQTQVHFSVMVGMLQIGAIRRYLLNTGRIKSEDELPSETSITTTVGPAQHPITSGGGMTNHFGMTEFKAPLLPTKSLRENLLEAEADYSKMHAVGSDKIFSEFIGPMSWPLPTKLRMLIMKLALKANAIPTANHFVCLIYSTQNYELLGNSVENIYEVMNTSHISPWIKMFLISNTIGNKLNLSVSTTSNIFTSQADIDWFTQVLLKEELDDLIASCEESIKENTSDIIKETGEV